MGRGGKSTPPASATGWLFVIERRGIGTGTLGRGIAWLDRPPAGLYRDFPAMTADGPQYDGVEGFVALSGNWYAVNFASN